MPGATAIDQTSSSLPIIVMSIVLAATIIPRVISIKKYDPQQEKTKRYKNMANIYLSAIALFLLVMYFFNPVRSGHVFWSNIVLIVLVLFGIGCLIYYLIYGNGADKTTTDKLLVKSSSMLICVHVILFLMVMYGLRDNRSVLIIGASMYTIFSLMQHSSVIVEGLNTTCTKTFVNILAPVAICIILFCVRSIMMQYKPIQFTHIRLLMMGVIMLAYNAVLLAKNNTSDPKKYDSALVWIMVALAAVIILSQLYVTGYSALSHAPPSRITTTVLRSILRPEPPFNDMFFPNLNAIK
jgi:hypothetical protein